MKTSMGGEVHPPGLILSDQSPAQAQPKEGHTRGARARHEKQPAPRVRVDYVAEWLCLTPRAVQDMAARGGLPGAARIGKFWTFDVDRLERFITEREQACQKISSKEEKPSGFVRPLTASKSEKAYERAMSKLLGKNGTSVSPVLRRRVKVKKRTEASRGSGTEI